MIRDMSLLDCIAVVKNLDDIHWKEVSAFTDYIHGDLTLNDMVIYIYQYSGIKMTCLNKEGVPVILTGMRRMGHSRLGLVWWMVSKHSRKRDWKEVHDYWYKSKDTFMRENGVNRLEIMTLYPDFGEEIFIKKIGFELESVQKNRGRNGESAKLWVKFQ